MAESRLFKPLKVGNQTLAHRLVLAPLTRFRADDDHVPLPFVAEYYAQRGSVPGTLLITEGTIISKTAGWCRNVPGIYTKKQVAAWKAVTDAVHARGSFIYCQLWALGRVADPEHTRELGVEIKSASPIPNPDNKDAVVPKEMTREDISLAVQDYAQAARNAIEAGFDGVELHGANGYLIDQFIQDNTNQRTDEYGCSIERRARFALEVARAVVSAIGAERTAIRLSPWSSFQGMRMKDPVPQYTYLIGELKKLRLAYLHLVEARITDPEASDTLDFAAEAWDNVSPVLVAGGFEPDTARICVDQQYKDREVAVAFGRFFISTPDLPFRIQEGLPLAPFDRSTFYTPKAEKGYTDYSFSKEWIKRRQ